MLYSGAMRRWFIGANQKPTNPKTRTERTEKVNLVTITFMILMLAANVYADSFELMLATFVSLDGASTDSLYNYASAVPVSRYYADGHFYFSEIYTDNGLNTETPPDIERILIVGNIPGEYIPEK